MSAAAFTATVKLVEITSPSRSSYFIKALYLCQFVVCKKSIWRNDADLNCKIIWIQQDLGQANWIRILTHPSKVIRQKFKSPPPLRRQRERVSGCKTNWLCSLYLCSSSIPIFFSPTFTAIFRRCHLPRYIGQLMQSRCILYPATQYSGVFYVSLGVEKCFFMWF